MDELLQLLSLYQSTLLAAMLAAACLSWMGVHLSARGQAMQVFSVGQGALLGVLVGLWVLPVLGSENHNWSFYHLAQHTLPVMCSFATSAAVFVLSRRFARTLHAGRDAFFASVFVGVSALGFLISGLVPGLEGQMAQAYFGDLATLNKHDAWILSALALGMGFYLYRKRWELLAESFHHAIFDRRKSILTRAFDGLSLVVIAFSVQYCGFLFTATFLFLPTTLFRAIGGYRRHLAWTGAWAAFSAGAGFVISLVPIREMTHTPTVPTMVGVCVLGAFIFWRKLWRSPLRPK